MDDSLELTGGAIIRIGLPSQLQKTSLKDGSVEVHSACNIKHQDLHEDTFPDV